MKTLQELPKDAIFQRHGMPQLELELTQMLAKLESGAQRAANFLTEGIAVTHEGKRVQFTPDEMAKIAPDVVADLQEVKVVCESALDYLKSKGEPEAPDNIMPFKEEAKASASNDQLPVTSADSPTETKPTPAPTDPAKSDPKKSEPKK